MNNFKTYALSRLLEINFLGKEILLKQLDQAETEIEEGFSYLFIKFKVLEPCDKFPYNVRVPVEMRAYQEGPPVVFLLHVIDGIVNELEIFTADSSKIDITLIKFDTIQYEIDEEICNKKRE